MRRRAIGIDIGATRIKTALVEAVGGDVASLAANELPTEFVDQEALIEALVGATATWRDATDRPIAIGVAVPGLVEREGGRVLRAPNLPLLDGMRIGAVLGAATGLPVGVDNDAHAAGLAEALIGAAAGADTAVCLTIGTGVGGAIIESGRLWRGHGGLAGEIGRLLIDAEGARFFEEGVGAAAVEGEYRSLAGGDPVAARDVTARAEAGDEAAREALAVCGRRLGIGLAILVNLLNPEKIVIGGGVAGAGEWLLGPARQEAERRAWSEAWRQCEVVTASLGSGAGAVGAALSCGLVPPEAAADA